MDVWLIHHFTPNKHCERLGHFSTMVECLEFIDVNINKQNISPKALEEALNDIVRSDKVEDKKYSNHAIQYSRHNDGHYSSKLVLYDNNHMKHIYAIMSDRLYQNMIADYI